MLRAVWSAISSGGASSFHLRGYLIALEVWATEVPSVVQGQSPGRESMARKPPEAEAVAHIAF